MILHVTGVETVEVTDPKGVCNLPDQGGYPAPQTGQLPSSIQPYPPTPQIPGPFGPTITPLNQGQIPRHPYTDRPLPATTRTWPTPIHSPAAIVWEKKWQPGFTGDPPGAVFLTSGDKWTKNMQLRNAGEDLKAGQPGTEQRNEI